jgi:hypothetical protein
VNITTMGCGPGLDSTADAVLYNAPVVIEWSSPHEQGRRLIGHRLADPIKILDSDRWVNGVAFPYILYVFLDARIVDLFDYDV